MKKESSYPLLSFIVPTYNNEKYIEKCISSIESQKYKNIEIIIINDGSTDNTSEVLRKLANKNKNIKVISQQNSGVSVARNIGLINASGDYVTFIDSDDYISEEYANYLMELIIKNEADFAYTTNMFTSKNDKQIKEDKIEIIDGKQSAALLLSPDIIVGSYNKIYKKSTIENNKLKFREDLYYGEGLNFIVKMSLFSDKVAVGKRKILYYRKNNPNSATTVFKLDKFHNGLRSLEDISRSIDKTDRDIDAMYRLHLATFYLGAITQIIENKKKNKYNNEYKVWKKELRRGTRFIIFNKRITLYRKTLILLGATFPHIVALMDEMRRTKIKRESV